MFSGFLIVSLGTVFAVEEDSVCGLIARNFEIDSSREGELLQPPTNNPNATTQVLFNVFIFVSFFTL
jgi:hypothetical protein